MASLRGEALAIGACEREVAAAPEQARALYLEGDKVRIDDSERLFLIALEADEPPRVLHATEGGTLRITSPLAHTHLPVVAFRTDDDPIAGRRRSGQRLSIVDTAGGSPPRTWIERPHTPIAWLT